MKNIPLEKNDDIELRIDSLSSDGQGVGRCEGFAVFVPLALPTEYVRAHIIKATPSYAIGKLERVITASKERVEPECEVFGRCGGCSLMHLEYQSQKEAKRTQVRDALERLGGFKGVAVRETIGMEDPSGYRNKGSFPVASINGVTELGFFSQHSHRIIPIHDCYIQNNAVLLSAIAVRDWARENGIEPYDETTHKGMLRHVVVRAASNTDGPSVMVTVVTKKRLAAADTLVQALQQRAPGVASIINNVNPYNTNVIFGSEFHLLWGVSSINENVMGLNFEISAESFLQVNPEQTVKLYSAAIAMLAPETDECIADVYCGIGTLSLLLAKKCGEVYGIENVQAAIENAKRNAKLNSVENVSFICGNAEDELPKLVSNGKKLNAVMVDPPRKGCEREALNAIISSGVKRMVYVSCNPATLARDCKILAENGGFEIKEVQPVDMFPMTHHVETCVLLSHKNSHTSAPSL